MMSVAHALQREKIIPFREDGDFHSARLYAKERGTKLPSNVLHDEYLSTDRWRAIGALYPAWSREVLVYPEKGGRFRVGMDVVDDENGWVLPACYVPKEALGRDRMALFVEPLEISNENGRTIVHPDPAVRMVLVHPFIQESGRGGLVDSLSGVPLDMKAGSAGDERFICRRDGTGVTPIARFTYGYKVSVHHVFAKCIPEDSFGFSGVGFF